MFDFSIVTGWIDETLRAAMPSWAALAIEFILIGAAILLLYAVIALILIYMERRVCGKFQCRIGPNRVGPKGTIQSVADMIKMLIKELIFIDRSDRFLFILAPFIVIVASVLAFSNLPFGRGLQVLDFNIGIFFLLSVSAIGVLGILLAGWSSNNKFSLIGAMRSGAQMISYELSVTLSILTMVILCGSMQLSTIVAEQADGWFIFKGHIPAVIAFIIYLIGRKRADGRLPYRIFRYSVRFLLPGRIPQPVYRGGCGCDDLPGRMDAFAHQRAGRFQRRDGLHSFGGVVLWQDVLFDLRADVVQVDLPASACGPDPGLGVEIPFAHRFGQPDADGHRGDIRFAFLSLR